jgi:hypothetical protein
MEQYLDCLPLEGSMTDRYPDFFIVGAQKAGTTTIFTQLDKVKEIFFPEIKEPHFFLSKPSISEKKYLHLYKNAGTRKAGDASTLYLSDPQSAYLIKNKNKNAKIIISLRDPVERMYSAYLMFSIKEKNPHTFNDIIDNPDNHYVRNSLYYENVKRFVDVFGFDDVKIIFFEELIKNQNQILNDLLRFLGVKETFQFANIRENQYSVPRPIIGRLLYNELVPKIGSKIITNQSLRYRFKNSLSKITPKPQITETQKLKAAKLFIEDSLKLESYLGRKLPWDTIRS